MSGERYLGLFRERLEADHVVRLKNGAQVEFQDCSRCKGDGEIVKPGRHEIEKVVRVECPTCLGQKVSLRLTTPLGRRLHFRWPDELPRAYSLAVDGAPPKAQPKGDPAKFGEDAPW